MKTAMGTGGAIRALTNFRGVVAALFAFSGVVNILALTGALYMLQIYDRVLSSHSVPTLLALSALAVGLYVFQGGLDVIRSRVLVRVGATLAEKLAPLAHTVSLTLPRLGLSTNEAMGRVRDVDTLRSFLSGQGPMALFDLPWMPLYLAFVTMLHPWLGAIILAGMLVLASLTALTEYKTRKIAAAANEAGIQRNNIADANTRNADVLQAMGFAGRAVARFQNANAQHLSLQMKAADVVGTFSGISKMLRMMLQSAILGLGAYLTLKGDLTAGGIIAASVAGARALAPVDLAIAHWKSLVAARQAHARLQETLADLPSTGQLVTLPAPSARLDVERITVMAPATRLVVLSDVAFSLEAGQALGLIGPSGSGKSTLARALTGIWPVMRGSVRLDEAELAHWAGDALGRHIGYLPQEITLFDGSIADNIARFDPEPDSDAILAASAAAGVHEMILRLPHGYETRLGANGTALSAGQRQRIALARALYGDPFLVVLDEPNSNLDSEGEAALTRAIQGVRERGGIVVVIAHRPSALAAVDMVGIVKDGKLAAFGPRDEILKQVMRPTVAAPAPGEGGEAAVETQRAQGGARS